MPFARFFGTESLPPFLAVARGGMGYGVFIAVAVVKPGEADVEKRYEGLLGERLVLSTEVSTGDSREGPPVVSLPKTFPTEFFFFLPEAEADAATATVLSSSATLISA